jgi:hypothetical protein
VVRGSARHAAIASSVIQTVTLPRRLNAASYSGQFVTRATLRKFLSGRSVRPGVTGAFGAEPVAGSSMNAAAEF